MSYERAAEVSAKAAYAFAGGTAFAGLTLNDIAVVVGILGTVFMCFLSWYYKHKHFELARRIAEAGLIKVVEGVEDDS